MSKIYIVIGTESSKRDFIGDEVVKSFGYDNVVSVVHATGEPKLFKIRNRPEWKKMKLLEKFEAIEKSSSDITVVYDWRSTVDINNVTNELKLLDVTIIIVKTPTNVDFSSSKHNLEMCNIQDEIINKFISDNNLSPVYQPTNADSPVFVRNSLELSPITTTSTIEIAVVSLT
jgi:hypothetical protein